MALFWMLFGMVVVLVFGWLLQDSLKGDSGDTTPTRRWP